MKDYLTLKTMADSICAAEGEADSTKRFTQLKGLASRDGLNGRKLLSAVPDVYGPRGALLFERIELIRARLLLAALDVNLESDQLANFAGDLAQSGDEVRGVNATLDAHSRPGLEHPPSAKASGGYTYGNGLETLIRGTKAGEEWFLTIQFKRTSQGQVRVLTQVRWSEWGDAEDRGSRALDLRHGETHIGTLNIPASALIAPLLDAM